MLRLFQQSAPHLFIGIINDLKMLLGYSHAKDMRLNRLNSHKCYHFILGRCNGQLNLLFHSPSIDGECANSLVRRPLLFLIASHPPFLGAIAETKKTNDNNTSTVVLYNKVSANGFHFRGNSVDQLGHVGYSLIDLRRMFPSYWRVANAI